MSKAAVRKPEIIATSANQIVLLKFRLTYKNVVLYSPDPRPPFPLAVLKGIWERLLTRRLISQALH